MFCLARRTIALLKLFRGEEQGNIAVTFTLALTRS
jgi:Flp pilus assembly protein TadG